MKTIALAGAATLSLLLAACGKTPNAEPENRQAAEAPATAQASQVYSGTGTVKSIKGDQVTIAHGPIEGIGWPAMTMTFKLDPPALAKGLKVGDRAAFGFEQRPDGPVVRRIQPMGAAQ